MKRKDIFFPAVFAASILAFTTAPVIRAQTSESDLRAEIEELKRGQQQINQQLQEIKRLLTERPAAPAGQAAGPQVAGKIFDLAENPVKGASTAKLTLVEFTDYQ